MVDSLSMDTTGASGISGAHGGSKKDHKRHRPYADLSTIGQDTVSFGSSGPKDGKANPVRDAVDKLKAKIDSAGNSRHSDSDSHTEGMQDG